MTEKPSAAPSDPVPGGAKTPAAKTAARPPLRPTREERRNALTHDQIADDVAAFERAGGRIEVLGNTPMLRSIPLSPSPAPPSPAPQPRASDRDRAQAAAADEPLAPGSRQPQ